MSAKTCCKQDVGVVGVLADYRVLVPVVVVVVTSPGAVDLRTNNKQLLPTGFLGLLFSRESYLEVVKCWYPVSNDRPDLFLKPVVVDLKVFYVGLLVEFGTAAGEIVAAVALTTEVHTRRVDDQGTV
jgi:hypothetical protein